MASIRYLPKHPSGPLTRPSAPIATWLHTLCAASRYRAISGRRDLVVARNDDVDDDDDDDDRNEVEMPTCLKMRDAELIKSKFGS